MQRLLRAESVLAERKKRSQSNELPITTSHNGQRRVPGPITRSVTRETRDHSRSSRRNAGSSQTTEMSSKNIECFTCHKRGHIAKHCPNRGTQARNPVRALSTATDETVSSNINPEGDEQASKMMWKWARVLSTPNPSNQSGSSDPLIVGPTYKVHVSVDGVKTRALLDHGSQVTIVRQQLLPMVKEKQQWSMDNCMEKTVPLESQPIGATGQELGAHGIAMLNILMEATGKTFPIPCYVLDSSRPLWSGELEDCGVLMGTNALVKHGFSVVHSDGTEVQPKKKDAGESTTIVKTIDVVLKKTVHLKPHQTKIVKGTVEEDTVAKPGVFMISPNEEVLAEKKCDVLETVMEGSSTKVELPLSNWGNCQVITV